MERCSICKGVWHPASGHYISETSRWCGPCTRDWVKELCGMQHRRWGGLRFYDHAKPPPPARESVFVFCIYELIPGTSCHYRPVEVRKTGVTFEEALARLTEEYPDNHVAEHLKGLWKEIVDETATTG